MRNKHDVLKLAREAGLPVTQELRCFGSDGQLRLLEVDRPVGDLVAELRELGVL